ncbi:MAG TPA: hypothetical protein VFJ57_05945 [Solirubrobacterales bacterium]|nr:hypothetical protein [Solirubrobacterales bacterium]
MKSSCLPTSSIPRAAALAAALLALFAAPAAAKTLAHFKVDLKATSKMTWSEDITSSCQGSGRLRTFSNGETVVTLRSRKQPVVTLEHEGGSTILAYAGGATGLPVKGTVTRKVKEEGFAVVAPAPGACGSPEPAPRDCGARAYPSDSQVSLAYSTPEAWPYSTAPPLTDVLTISGPNSAAWTGGPPFRNCKSPARSDLLADQEGETELTPLKIPISIPELLARKHVTVKRSFSQRFDALPKGLRGVSGARPVKIETTVSLSFARVGRS